MAKVGVVIAIILSLCSISFASYGSGPAPSGDGRPSNYWQQEVNYILAVQLEQDLRTIQGKAQIEYINNSPDTLRKIYLKAFPNAIQKDSYADKKQRTTNNYSLTNLDQDQWGSMAIELSAVSADVGELSQDNTIYRLDLFRPILPGDTFNFSVNFVTVLPTTNNMRMGLYRNVIRAAYWYPQLCVYDWELGWVNSQYIGWGECYGDYGKFDVSISAPENQVVAATGILVNEAEALPVTLRDQLDISNYLKPKSEWPILDLDPTRQKLWHYVARNVNDFAWTAAADFCIDSDSINGVEIVAYPLKQKAHGWSNAVQLGKEAVETFSELYFPYQWPVMRICDAYDGMEYPMLTNCSGSGPSPTFSMLLYHEIGHQWFMGQVGSNQVDRPFLDEGFTTHIEHIVMEKYNGRQGNYNRHKTWYQKKFAPDVEDRNVRGFLPLLQLIRDGYDKPMVFSYDQGEEYWPYRVSAYYKSAAMHYSLRSILGDSLYFKAMRQYCDRWFFGHPYETDFSQLLEDVTGIELDAYLEQWYYGKQHLDYALDGREKEKDGHYYVHTIKLKNNGRFVSPIDVAVIWEQGDTTFFTIPPEGMEITKRLHTLMPVWNQFRRFDKKYQFEIRAQREIAKVVIDPGNLLMDIERRNNQSGFLSASELRFDNMKYDRIDPNKYMFRWRPDLWYDDPNGLHLGGHLHGSYLKHDDKFRVDISYMASSERFGFNFERSDHFPIFGRNGRSGFQLLLTDYRFFSSFWTEAKRKSLYTVNDYEYFRLELNNSSFEDKDEAGKYLYNQRWDVESVYWVCIKGGGLKTFHYGELKTFSNILMGTYETDSHQSFILDQHKVALRFKSGKRNWLSLQIFVNHHSGKSPSQFVPQLSMGAEINSYLDHKLFRSPGTIPNGWRNDVSYAGGLVRGYQNRNLFFEDSKAFSVELTPPDLLPYRWFSSIPLVGKFLSKIDQQLFFDYARISFDSDLADYSNSISQNEFSYGSHDYFSTGLSLTFPPVWSDHKIRIDFPIYLNEPGDTEEKYEFRVSLTFLPRNLWK